MERRALRSSRFQYPLFGSIERDCAVALSRGGPPVLFQYPLFGSIERDGGYAKLGRFNQRSISIPYSDRLNATHFIRMAETRAKGTFSIPYSDRLNATPG